MCLHIAVDAQLDDGKAMQLVAVNSGVIPSFLPHLCQPTWQDVARAPPTLHVLFWSLCSIQVPAGHTGQCITTYAKAKMNIDYEAEMGVYFDLSGTQAWIATWQGKYVG